MSRISNSVIGSGTSETKEERINVRSVTTDESYDLTPEQHGNRLFVLNAVVASGALQINLPKATGTGNKYTIVNNAVQTQSVVVAAKGIDVMSGAAFVFDSTAANAGVGVFLTSDISDKYTFNITTMGGLKGDTFEAWDMAGTPSTTGIWLVSVKAVCSGNVATGFSKT